MAQRNHHCQQAAGQHGGQQGRPDVQRAKKGTEHRRQLHIPRPHAAPQIKRQQGDEAAAQTEQCTPRTQPTRHLPEKAFTGRQQRMQQHGKHRPGEDQRIGNPPPAQIKPGRDQQQDGENAEDTEAHRVWRAENALREFV